MNIRAHFEAERKQLVASVDRRRVDFIQTVITNEKQEDIVISSEIAKREDFNYFLWTIRDYEEDEWYTYNPEDESWTFHVGDHQTIPSAPQMYWFDQLTAAETKKRMDEAWEKRSVLRPMSRSVQLMNAIDCTQLEPGATLSYAEKTKEMLKRELRLRKASCAPRDPHRKALTLDGKKAMA